jgi:SnoaL-like domain
MWCERTIIASLSFKFCGARDMASELELKVQWLVDRAQISDLLYSFAAALDTKNWRAYADNYMDGGYIELPDPESKDGGTFILNKEKMLESVPKSLERYSATHHISSNHQITIDGEGATARSYLQAVHVSGDPHEHWTAGGWYDSWFRRKRSGWKFAKVKLTPVWLAGSIKAIKP